MCIFVRFFYLATFANLHYNAVRPRCASQHFLAAYSVLYMRLTTLALLAATASAGVLGSGIPAYDGRTTRSTPIDFHSVRHERNVAGLDGSHEESFM